MIEGGGLEEGTALGLTGVGALVLGEGKEDLGVLGVERRDVDVLGNEGGVGQGENRGEEDDGEEGDLHVEV